MEYILKTKHSEILDLLKKFQDRKSGKIVETRKIWFFVNFGGKKIAYLWLKYLIVSTLISIIKVADVRIF